MGQSLLLPYLGDNHPLASINQLFHGHQIYHVPVEMIVGPFSWDPASPVSAWPVIVVISASLLGIRETLRPNGESLWSDQVVVNVVTGDIFGLVDHVSSLDK